MSEISERVLSSFRSSQSFRDYSANEERRVTAIKFTSSGKYLMATNNKALIEIFDCNTSKHSIVPVKKYGCHKFDFVDENQIVVASAFPRKNNFVSLLDVEKQHYVTFYAGHSAHVKSVSVTPNRNVFLTASIDERVLLWDVRQPYAQGQLVVPEHYKYLAPPIDNSNMGPMLDCHPSGQFFAVGVDSQFLGLHDFRNIDLGPFIRPFTYKRDDSNWSSVKFSSDGNQMVIGTTSPKVRVIETKMGKLQNVFPGRRNNIAAPIEASYSPASQYILSGSSDGQVHIFNTIARGSDAFSKVADLQSNRPEAITSVEFNPKYLMMATASSCLSIWVPNNHK